MSLRGRLIAGLLAVAAAGLLVAALATYVAQRSFLVDRVDDQARGAVQEADRALGEAGFSVPGDRGRRFGGPGPGRGRGGSGFGPPGRGPGEDLPAGTAIQRRTDDGAVVGSTLVLGASRAPELPADLVPGRPVTVDGAAGRFRVLAAVPGRGSGLVVVALPLADVDASLNRLLAVEAVVILVVLALVAAGASFVVRLGLRPLDRITTQAGAVAAGSLSERVDPADGRTEVGRLGLALNAMLGRLETAFAEREASSERLRQFLADASHELRTPLASIRGYAELFRLGATEDPEALAKAMRRIEEEATRMGVLVEDLLALARLDEVPDRPHEPVDLATLAEDAVTDARAVAPDREISLAARDVPVVLADADGLRQVLANLLRNALTHTPAGTPVEVEVAHVGAEVVVEVRDHGPGLPPGDPQQLFGRFWRAEGGRTKGKAGAGLGLAIVAGIVEAHGGRVLAADAPGGGARFVVALPAQEVV